MLALLTDLYQLTMAAGYWQTESAEREAVFHLTFRRPPFGGGYAIAAGIAPALELVEKLRFEPDDLAYLATLTDARGARLFGEDFLAYLRAMTPALTVDAVPEGSVVFPHEPLLRVTGPIIQAQLLETALLTVVNFQTLIATKAARICQAARGRPVIEFGLRRAQGIDGGLSASRAAYIGGCAATSNVLAGKRFGIPVRGTHAHSWVMFHHDELEAFRAYARAMPGNALFLVDTFDTLEGVKHAILVGQELRKQGHTLLGIRLDSGDLAHLSIEARKLLDAAGFESALILASNDLDEHLITSLHEQGAQISSFGVGTRLVTGHDQPALGGVYKLGAVREADGAWRHVIKLSEQPIKISNPGRLGVKRLFHQDALVGDIIYDVDVGLGAARIHDIENPLAAPLAPAHDRAEDLLVTMIERGQRVRADEPLDAAVARAAAGLAALSPRTKRFHNPQPYPVGLDDVVHERKRALVASARRPPQQGDLPS